MRRARLPSALPAVLVWAGLLLGSCGPTVRPPHPLEPSAVDAGVDAGAAPTAGRNFCRLGPHDGPPLQLAERGIGGTGSGATGSGATVALPVTSPAPMPAGGAPKDRGIGGTGIVGVITGFGSVCLAGLEVQYDPALPIGADAGLLPGSFSPGGFPASATPPPASGLRAGQLAVVAASGPAGALVADSIALRHEVVGPLETVSPRGGGAQLLQVAGQPVLVQAPTYGDAVPAPGAWLAVSGLRDRSGTIVATRLDVIDPASVRGQVLVHGRLSARAGVLRLGGLLVVPRARVLLADGAFVTVTGTLSASSLDAASLVADAVQGDPDAGFGPGFDALYVETYVDGLGLGLDGPAWQGGLGGVRDRLGVGREVVALRRGRNGRFQATGAADASSGPGSPAAPGGSSSAPRPGDGGRGGFGSAPASPGPGRGGAAGLSGTGSPGGPASGGFGPGGFSPGGFSPGGFSPGGYGPGAGGGGFGGGPGGGFGGPRGR